MDVEMALIKGHNRGALPECGNRTDYAETDNPEPTCHSSHCGPTCGPEHAIAARRMRCTRPAAAVRRRHARPGRRLLHAGPLLLRAVPLLLPPGHRALEQLELPRAAPPPVLRLALRRY